MRLESTVYEVMEDLLNVAEHRQLASEDTEGWGNNMNKRRWKLN